MIYDAPMSDEAMVSLLDLDSREKAVLLAFLELSCNRLTPEDVARLQHKEDLDRVFAGKKPIKRHQKHDVFTVRECLEYYESHDLDKLKVKALETFAARVGDRTFVTLEKIVEKVATYDKWKDRYLDAIRLEMDRAAHRLANRGFAVFFPGTPRFSAQSITVNLDRVVASIKQLDRPAPPRAAVPVGVDGVPDIDDGTSGEVLDAIESLQDSYEPRAIRSLDDLTPEQRLIVEEAIGNENRVTLQVVLGRAEGLSRWKIYKPKTLYMRFYRAAKNLEKIGLAELKKNVIVKEINAGVAIDRTGKPGLKSDGMQWVFINREKIEQLALAPAQKPHLRRGEKDLIEGNCEIQTHVNDPATTSKRDVFAMPKNANSTRRAAIRHLMGVKMLDYEEHKRDREEKRKSRGPYYDSRILIDLFKAYSDETVQKIIVLMHRITGDTIGSDYSTRFNDYDKSIQRLKAYEWAHDKSLADHNKAVFLTLTTNPALFPNLWVANRHMAKAFNRFMSYLSVKIGKRKQRPKYIAAAEYTKTGLLHLHILIFDHTHLFSSDRSVEQQEISALWDRCGQGKIVKAYGLNNVKTSDGGRKWHWMDKPPEDARGMTGGNYLKKYLKKCAMAILDNYGEAAETLSQYWIENKRFSTCSRSFLPPKDADLPGDGEKGPPIFALHHIGYGVTLDDAFARGEIDRIVYRRWSPDDYPHTPDGSEGG